jgi:hypothetical protein
MWPQKFTRCELMMAGLRQRKAAATWSRARPTESKLRIVRGLEHHVAHQGHVPLATAAPQRVELANGTLPIQPPHAVQRLVDGAHALRFDEGIQLRVQLLCRRREGFRREAEDLLEQFQAIGDDLAVARRLGSLPQAETVGKAHPGQARVHPQARPSSDSRC